MDRRLQAGIGIAALFALGLFAAIGDAARDRAGPPPLPVSPQAASQGAEAAGAGIDFAAMSPAEREGFRAAVRAYLMEHPEVLIEAIDVLESRGAAAEGEIDRALVAAEAGAVFDDGYSWVGGNPEGDLTLVEFIDYRCGFCRRAHPEVEALVERDGGIRLVMKEFPILGPESELAARFAVAVHQLAGAEAYKAAHDALFGLRGPVTEAVLDRIAGEIGAEAAAVRARMDADEVSQVLRETRALAERLRIAGTPTFVLGERDAGGQMLRGYLPPEAMLAIVAQERG